MNFKRLLLLMVMVLAQLISIAQDFSNKGTDFWVAYPAHIDGTGSAMGIYITSDVNATGQITVGNVVVPFTVAANSVTRKFIGPNGAGDAPNTSVYLSKQEGIQAGAGIHITSDKPVAVFSHIIRSARSGATLVLPVKVWGRKYVVPSIQNLGATGNEYGFGEVDIMASEANTTVQITPTIVSRDGTKAANVPYSITLANPGDVYQVQFQRNADISGTKIESVSNGSTGCKPIGVFSASTWSAFGCSKATSGDNIYQQIFPTGAWGKQFLTAPFKNRPFDIVRVFVDNASTVVTKTELGVKTTLTGLQANSFYEFNTANPVLIEADNPVSVAQYMVTQDCDTRNNSGCNSCPYPGDPEMVVINPVEQTINNITVFSAHQNFVPTGQSAVKQCFLNIIIKTAATANFKINNAAPTGSFVPIPGTQYSYLQEDVSTKSATNPVQTLTADSGFIAVAYGYGQVESYGYNAGTNVKDLYQFVALQNQYATVSESATCKNTPFYFSITLPYQPTSLSWDFNSNPNLSPNSTVTNNAPVPDSNYIKDGKTLYVYSIKSIYSFNATGTYPIKVTVNNQTSDGCNGIQEITYDVVVNDPPAIDFSYTQTGCAADTTFFLDASNGLGRKIIKWQWDFGDGTTDTVQNPVKKFATPNTYNVKLVAYTELGCLNTVTKPIAITAKPLANFGVSFPTCVGSSITFSDSSTIASGNIIKWIWNFGNGNSVTNNDNRSVTQTYTQIGTYTVSLQVETITGCRSLVFTKNISINALPVTDFSFTATCLPDSTIFTNLSTISDGTPLSYFWTFGDNTSSILKDPLHKYNGVGPFNVKLMATSGNGCTTEKLVTLNNIYAQPKANFAVAAQICLGDTLVFTDQSIGAGNTLIKWRWDFNDGTFDTTQNPKHFYTIAKTYNVKLTVFNDKGCISDTATKTVTINPKPNASFVTSTPLCETKAIIITDKSNNAGNITLWNWDFGDQTNASYTNGNAFTKTYNASGTYNIKLGVTTDKGCKNDTVKTINIYPQPQVNFILPEICLNDAFAEFFDSSYISDGTEKGFTYLWKFGDANANTANPDTSTVKDAKHKFSAVGVYNVSLTVQSKNGCTSSITKSFTVNGAIPLANFTVLNSNSLCSNTTVQIQNTSTVDFGSVTKLEIIWDFAGAPTQIVVDDNPSPNKIYTHLYPNSPVTKTYQVKVRAYSGGSCVNEKTSNITVNASPKVSFTTIPGICLDASPRQIIQASEVGGVAGSGGFSGLGISTQGIFNPAATGAGTFPIQYLYTSNLGCRDSATQSITVWKSPQANWNFSSPVCEANAVSFTDSSVANFSKITQWNWNFGDNTTDSRTTGSTFTKAFAKAGTYNVTLQVKTDSGCVSPPSSKVLIVHPLPVVDFSLPAVCLGTNAQFNDLSTIADNTQNQFTYLWNFGDPNDPTTSTLKNPIHKYLSGGPFTVKLTVTSANGCNSTVSKQLTTIYNLPQAGFIVAPPAACLGSTFIFTDTSRGVSGNIINWNWSFGDGTISSSQNTSRNYTTAGIYKAGLIVTNDKGCVSLPFTLNVDVQAYPTVDAGPDLVVLEGGSLVLNPTVTGTGLNYRWTPSTYLNNDQIKNPTTSPLADVTYKITVTSGAGCSASDQVFVKLLKEPSVPNVFSPNNDGINDTWNIDYLNSYPGATIEIFNRNGQMVYRSVGYDKPWDGKVNGNPLPVGVYYYIINPKNGRKQITGSVTILR